MIKFFKKSIFFLLPFMVSCVNVDTTNSDNNSIESIGTTNSDNNIVESVGMTLEEKNAYYNGENKLNEDNEYDTPYGVGRSINALEDKYIEISYGGNQIFNNNKITQLNWKKSKIREQEATVISETSISSFNEALTTSFSKKMSANVGVEGCFTAGLEEDFNMSNKYSTNNNTKEIVAKMSHNINGFLIEIEGYKDPRNFQSILSDNLLNDLKKIENGSLLLNDFFRYYGTHVVMAGYYGGRIECNYHLMFDSTEVTDTMMLSYASKAAAEIKDAGDSLSVSAEDGYSIKNEIGIKEEASKEYFSYKGRGGKYIDGSSYQGFINEYSSWVDSFNNDEENYSVLVDVPNNSLIPIWYLFPDEYQNAKEIVANEFVKLAENCKNEWLEKCAYGYQDNTINDIINYAGGAGTQNNPYKISTINHLRNIEKNMSSYFELVNDIDLNSITEWISIGGYYAESKFEGNLNGNGFKIVNFKSPKSIVEKKNRSYFGLFGVIGTKGIVENIIFENVDIKITGPKNNNGNQRSWYGLVAGRLEGKVINVEANGNYNVDNYTNGSAFIGGIVGCSLNANVINCINNMNIYASRYAVIIGGISASASGGVFSNCINNGNLEASGLAFGGGRCLVGGICGTVEKDNHPFIDSCKNNGNLKVSNGAFTSGDKKKADIYAWEYSKESSNY